MNQLVLVVAMVTLMANALEIPLPKYHDGDDWMTHVKQWTHVCIMNGENIYVHKLQYFPKHFEKTSNRLVRLIWHSQPKSDVDGYLASICGTI